MTPATNGQYEAVIRPNGDSPRGCPPGAACGERDRADGQLRNPHKEHNHSTRRIDLAVAAVMAYATAAVIERGGSCLCSIEDSSIEDVASESEV
jgi:hypothetical protein